ncbi:MAG: zinc ABC transporter substrate-binding protein [Gammaproteobacteria bacterium]|nr:zinc ABC transporter substrate-binding protein [Gammaproteobacteria bacterium]
MKTSKWIFAVLGLLLTGAAQADMRVFTCEPEWAALVAELGGDAVDAKSAITGQQDVHYIQARPSLIAGVRRADLVICTGADLEIGWLPLLLRQGGNPDVQPGKPGFFEASQHVDLLEVPQKVDRAEGDIHPYGNPHIQLDPRNIGKIATALAERMQQLDPENAEAYARRYADFAERWKAAIGRWTEEATPFKGRKFVTHHRSWVYLNDWLGLVELANLELKPGIPPSAAHLAELLDTIEGEDVTAIIRSTYQSPRASEWLADRSGAPAIVLPHTVGSVDGTDDLFDVFDVLIERLRSAAQ